MPTLRLHLLGPPRIEYSGQSVALASQKALALLFYLALEGRTPQSREKLAAMLWEESDEHHARRSLNDVLYKLRQAFPSSDHLSASGDWVQFNSGRPSWVDAQELQGAAAALSSAPDPVSVTRAIRAADLYRGEFLQGFELKDSESFSSWVKLKRENLERSFAGLLRKLSAYYSEQHDYRRAIEYSLRLVQADPLDESTHRGLMRLHYLMGDPAKALGCYHECRDLLHAELGIDPSEQTQQLAALILRGDTLALREPASKAPTLGLELDRPPFVNRDDELRALDASLRSATRGQLTVVVIEGEAGIGKTRLVEEFIARQASRALTPLLGRCHPSESPTPAMAFMPIVRQALSLRRTAGSPPGSDPRWQRLDDMLMHWEHGRTAPDTKRTHTYQQLAPDLLALLRETATTSPVVLVVDDYQWADSHTRDTLGYLVRSLTDARIMFILAYRPDDLSHDAELAVHKLALDSRATHINVAHLTEEQTAQLISSVARGVAGRTLPRRIVDGARGNPLFAIELTRALFRPASAAPHAEPLPDSMRALVRSRVRRLDSATLEFLLTAAVAGEQSSFRTVQRTSGLSRQEALAALDTLLRMHLLEEQSPAQLGFTYDGVRQLVTEGVSSTHTEALSRRLARVRPITYRQRLERATAQLAKQLRLYQRQRHLAAQVFRNLLRFGAHCLVSAFVAFAALKLIPSGPFTPPSRLPSAAGDALAKYYGLELTPPQQFLRYIRQVGTHLDFGPSYAFPHASVTDLLRQHLPTSAGLWMCAGLLAAVVGVALGLLSLRRRGSLCEHLSSGVINFGLVVPAVALGPLLIWGFSVASGHQLPAEWGEGPTISLPAVCLALGCAALIARSVRDAGLHVAREALSGVDIASPQRGYVRTLSRILFVGLVSTLRLARPLCSTMVASSLLVEAMFDVPGIGQQLVAAVETADYPLLVNGLLFYSLLVAALELVAGVTRAALTLISPVEKSLLTAHRSTSAP